MTAIPNIYPVTDLKRNFNDITTLCRETQKPVFLTKNGYAEYVFMDVATYEQFAQSFIERYEYESDLHACLVAANAECEAGRYLTLDDAFAKAKQMRKARYGE